MKQLDIAIVGATGAVGQELIKLLELRKFPVRTLRLFSSPASAGKQMQFAGDTITIEAFEVDKVAQADIAFLATSGSHSLEFSKQIAEKGTLVIDNSSAFRLDDDVPLVVPGVNDEAAKSHKGIIANPNCSTIQMVTAINPIYQLSRIKRIIVSTYQAVSGAGKGGMKELQTQMSNLSNNEPLEVAQFTRQIAMNVIPHIDTFQENEYTREEMKMHHETRKILGDDELKVSATCVRVPVIRAHSEAITVDTEDQLDIAQVKQALAAADNLEYPDLDDQMQYPTPLDATEHMLTWVGRVRKDIAYDNGISLWCVADQLWKGAALNAIEIAELDLV